MRELIEQLQAETARLETFRQRAERLHVEHRLELEDLRGRHGRRERALSAARRQLAEIEDFLEPR
jgi:hypothetical protein